MKGLKEIEASYDEAGEARGRGLMTGIEVVSDADTKAPGAGLTHEIEEEAKARGLIVGSGGLEGNVLRIKPPLVIDEDQLDKGLSILHEAFDAVT